MSEKQSDTCKKARMKSRRTIILVVIQLTLGSAKRQLVPIPFRRPKDRRRDYGRFVSKEEIMTDMPLLERSSTAMTECLVSSPSQCVVQCLLPTTSAS
ncbi:hypothetical protein JAAARDRAFT_327473 [Jaapia argillacea MUCL 33604]|uniref:Uncharacterized protein n=1 Tax=Jaapia argillacea MUCL 33604 TaxID=933084 RepID=A0A067PLD8_9AGAM|nr:hypothetical protein JAAARDRAFT_327473 [Jaapia argillacea MUCL 33604]